MTEETHVFYTVFHDAPGYSVRYIASTTRGVKTFRGPYNDPGEASQEFKAHIGHEKSWYLDPDSFQEKARKLAREKARER